MKVFSYWSGPITWMERLSAASAKSSGHELTVFSYEPQILRREGLEAKIEDAREITYDNSLSNIQNKFPDHFSDHFRLEALAKGRGTWIDLDMLLLKRLPDTEYTFGWQEDDIVCNAVLRIPARSPLLDEYLAICRKRPVSVAPPWLPRRERMRIQLKHWSKRIRGRRGIAMPYGPTTLTHLVEKHGLAKLALPQSAFFPVHWSEILDLLTDNRFVPNCDSFAVHLWRNASAKLHGSPRPSPDSWLGRKCHELGVSGRDA